MKRINVILMGAFVAVVLAFGSYVLAQTVESQNVVGFVKIPLATGWNLVSLPMQKVASYTGTIQNNSGNNITVSGTPWSVGQYNWGVLGQEPDGSNSYFYVEITDATSAFEGRHMYITNNTADTLTIKGGMPADINDNDLNGKTFKIVAANRIRDIFGDPNTPSSVPLTPNTDYIYLFSGGWGAAINYTGDSAPPAQRRKYYQGGLVVNNLPVDRDEAMLISYGGSGTNLTISGEVSGNDRAQVFSPGWNLVGGDVVMSEIIGQTSLSNNLKANIDYIYPWSNGWVGAIVWTGSLAPPAQRNKFFQGGDDVTASFEFEMAKAYLFNVSSNFVWRRDTPLD